MKNLDRNSIIKTGKNKKQTIIANQNDHFRFGWRFIVFCLFFWRAWLAGLVCIDPILWTYIFYERSKTEVLRFFFVWFRILFILFGMVFVDQTHGRSFWI